MLVAVSSSSVRSLLIAIPPLLRLFRCHGSPVSPHFTGYCYSYADLLTDSFDICQTWRLPCLTCCSTRVPVDVSCNGQTTNARNAEICGTAVRTNRPEQCCWAVNFHDIFQHARTLFDNEWPRGAASRSNAPKNTEEWLQYSGARATREANFCACCESTCATPKPKDLGRFVVQLWGERPSPEQEQ